MKPAEPWWPSELGDPSSSGAQNGMRYAFFADKHRLLIDRDGKRTLYDSADHTITGVQQQSGDEADFSTNNGTVSLADLRTVDL